MRPILIAFTLFAAVSPAAADIGPKPRQYASGLEARSDLEGLNIEMSAEEVEVKLVATKDDKHQMLVVDAVFHMTNLGDATEIEEGFPVGPVNNMSEFRVEIDGKRADIELANVARGETGKPRADYWYVWKAKYSSKAASRQVVHYVVDLRPGGVKHQITDTEYILHTGAPWKNPIGRATVTFRVEGMPAGNVYAVAPTAGLKREAGVWTWTFENLEPTSESDIRIRYDSLKSWEDDVAELRAKTDWNSRAALAELLCEAAARQGRVTLSEAEMTLACGALDALLAGAQEKDGAWTLPATDPSGEALPFSNGNGRGLMENVARAVQLCERNPSIPAAREVLKRWVSLGEAIRAGSASSGTHVIALSDWTQKEQGPEFDEAIKRGRAILNSK